MFNYNNSLIPDRFYPEKVQLADHPWFPPPSSRQLPDAEPNRAIVRVPVPTLAECRAPKPKVIKRSALQSVQYSIDIEVSCANFLSSTSYVVCIRSL